MEKKYKVKNMKGKDRPLLLSDKLGYDSSVGDELWETQHKQNWKKLPNGEWQEK